jgi:hypothetical protein
MGNPIEKEISEQSSGVKKIEQGNPLSAAIAEATRGSLEHMMQVIRMSFFRQFGEDDEEGAVEPDFWIADMFQDFIVVSGPDLGPAQFYRVDYQ